MIAWIMIELIPLIKQISGHELFRKIKHFSYHELILLCAKIYSTMNIAIDLAIRAFRAGFKTVKHWRFIFFSRIMKN